MGNTCVGPNLGNNGFLQSVTAAVWRSRQTDNTLPLPNGESSSTNNNSEVKSQKPEKPDSPSVSSSKGGGEGGGGGRSDALVCVQSTPPVPVKITGEVIKSIDATKSIKRETSIARGNEEVGKQNKPSHIKRVSSVGLQVESVLQRKTGNLKEIYTLGRKLGQGQFGTTFLCVEKGNGKEFACKSIAKRKLTTEEDVEDVRREIQIMHHLAGHPSVISVKM